MSTQRASMPPSTLALTQQRRQQWVVSDVLTLYYCSELSAGHEVGAVLGCVWWPCGCCSYTRAAPRAPQVSQTPADVIIKEDILVELPASYLLTFNCVGVAGKAYHIAGRINAYTKGWQRAGA